MIKIGIVDDHAVVREGLKALFSGFVEFRVAGEASSGREAIDLVRTTELDVLLMDLSMPDQSGVDALAAIKARRPDLPVLILSGFPETHYALAQQRRGVVRLGEAAEDEHGQVRTPCLDGRERVDAALVGHREVHQQHVEIAAADELQRLAAVGSLARDAQVDVVGQELPEAGANDRMIVDDHNANHVVSRGIDELVIGSAPCRSDRPVRFEGPAVALRASGVPNHSSVAGNP